MVSNKSDSFTIKAVACLLLLALTITCAASARILDEEIPPTDPVAAEASDPVDEPDAEISPTALVSGVAPFATPITQVNANPTVGISTNIANTKPPPITVAPETSVAGPNLPKPDVGPVAGVADVAIPSVTEPNLTPAAASSASVASADPHPKLSFVMHDVLGGSNPTAKAVTGMVTNLAVTSQIPLGASNIGVANTNGMVQNKPNNQMNALGLPCLSGSQLSGGKTVKKPSFERMTVINDVLTEGLELGSALVGKAQGFYVVGSEDGSGQCVALTAMFNSENYADSINFVGVLSTLASESQVGIMGGTGKYVNAEGYATVKTILSGNHHDTDGLETMMKFTVYIA